MRYVERYLKPGNRILEIGAVTGRYSHALARRGYIVDAVEFVEHNIKVSDSAATALDFRMAALPKSSTAVGKEWFNDVSFVGDSLTPVSYTHLTSSRLSSARRSPKQPASASSSN